MGVTPWMPVTLVEIYGHVLLWKSVLSVETSVHVLPRSYVHVLPRASLIVLTRVCVSVHGLPRASVHMPPWASTITVDVSRVCISFCLTNYCKVTLSMDLGQLMSTSGVILEIPCIISRNLWNVAPCSGLVKKYAYISTVEQYFREKTLF